MGIAVVGGGVSGLTCGVRLAVWFPVRIVDGARAA
jgi:protoporphyrinogen oxidase